MNFFCEVRLVFEKWMFIRILRIFLAHILEESVALLLSKKDRIHRTPWSTPKNRSQAD